jgi:hypothetical protein
MEMPRIILISLLLCVSAALSARASDSDSTALGQGARDAFLAASPFGPGTWSIETSLTFPIARIYMAKASYRASEASEWGMGAAFQNWKNTDVAPMGQANAWTVLLSYRRYLWRNLHVEGELWPAYNRFESYVDDQRYSGFELWVEYKIGYAFDIGSRFRLNVQPGIGHALWQQERWPDVEYDNLGEFVSGSLIFVPQVLVSWRPGR